MQDLAFYKDLIDQCKRIVFHQYSHLDDAACQWFLREIIQVQGDFTFQPNDQLVIDREAGEFGLDVIHPNAVKGFQHEDGSFSSAFRFLVEVYFPDTDDIRRRAVDPIVAWVDGDDNSGSATKAILGEEHPLLETLGLTNLLDAYKTKFDGHGDQIINHHFGREVLSTLYEHQLVVEKARQKVREECEIRVDGIVAVCVGHVPRPATGYPQQLAREQVNSGEGVAEPKIFLYRDPKMGLGMVRMVDDLRLDRKELQEFINGHNGPEWFFHPGGFMAACGSGTTPRSPDTIPIQVGSLTAKLNSIYGD